MLRGFFSSFVCLQGNKGFLVLLLFVFLFFLCIVTTTFSLLSTKWFWTIASSTIVSSTSWLSFLFSLSIFVCKLCAQWLLCWETNLSFLLSSQSQFSWEHYIILSKMALPKLLVLKIYFSSSGFILAGDGHMHCFDYLRDSHNQDQWKSMPKTPGVTT